MKIEKIYFSPQEAAVIGMALGALLDDLAAMKKDKYINMPWSPEARKSQKEILEAATGAARKLEKYAGIKCELPPYNTGDEDDFLTKES